MVPGRRIDRSIRQGLPLSDRLRVERPQRRAAETLCTDLLILPKILLDQASSSLSEKRHPKQFSGILLKKHLTKKDLAFHRPNAHANT